MAEHCTLETANPTTRRNVVSRATAGASAPTVGLPAARAAGGAPHPDLQAGVVDTGLGVPQRGSAAQGDRNAIPREPTLSSLSNVATEGQELPTISVPERSERMESADVADMRGRLDAANLNRDLPTVPDLKVGK